MQSQFIGKESCPSGLTAFHSDHTADWEPIAERHHKLSYLVFGSSNLRDYVKTYILCKRGEVVLRVSGILMHITSLPGPYGLGTMGKAAYEFVDFLEEAGQSIWQILPLSPTGYGDSPYQSCSTYAGNHYLIDLDLLVEEGLLEREQIQDIRWNVCPERADFGLLYQSRLRVLRLAYERFKPDEQFETFCRENSSWLPDFALYMALKEETGGAPWYQWEDSLKRREPEAVWQARQRLEPVIQFYNFVQYLFFKQWNALHSYANAKNIRIIGDVPIYVPYDSCDVWSDPELFQLDSNLTPEAVAGCPPDAFSEDGQLWGNPLYRWERHAKDRYGWWLRRLGAAGKLYDMVRIDHFRGFESYWSVPYGDTTAKGGKWVKGPGMHFINAVREGLPNTQMIAEDLGFLTPEVLKLRDDSGFPGMKVLEFAFDTKAESEYQPHLYHPNTVCYVGTHDNMTLRQWLETTDPETVDFAAEYIGAENRENMAWAMLRTAMASVSDLCVIQIQDYLQLGAEARMNFPGTTTNANWTWRATDGYLQPELAKKIHRLTGLYGRLGDQK